MIIFSSPDGWIWFIATIWWQAGDGICLLEEKIVQCSEALDYEYPCTSFMSLQKVSEIGCEHPTLGHQIWSISYVFLNEVSFRDPHEAMTLVLAQMF